MAVQQGRTNSQEVRVARVVDLDNTPRVLAGAHLAASNLHNVLGANNGKGHQAAKLGVLLDGVLVIFFDVVGEVVDGDAVMLDILHDQLLGLGELGGGKRVGPADDGNNVGTGSEALHQLNVELAEAVRLLVLVRLVDLQMRAQWRNIPMTSRCDEVKHSVDTVVPESGVTLDTRLLGQNIIVLSLEIANNLGEARFWQAVLVTSRQTRKLIVPGIIPCFIIDLVAETGSVDDGQGDASTLLIQLKFCFTQHVLADRGCDDRSWRRAIPRTNCDGLDLNTILDVSSAGIV